MDILGTIILWIFIAFIAAGGLSGIVMLCIGARNLYRKKGSGTDVLLIILGLIIALAAAALIVFIIILNSHLSAEIQQGPMYSTRV